MLSIPRWLRRLGAGICAAALIGVAAPSPAMAATDDQPYANFFFDKHTIGVAGGGTVAYGWVEGRNLRNPKISWESLKIQGIADVTFPDWCTLNGTRATCVLPNSQDFRVQLPILLTGTGTGTGTGTATATGAPGDKGELSFQYTADNLSTIDGGFTTTLRDGADLQFDGGSASTAANPGDTVNVPVAAFNVGATPIAGVQFWLAHGSGVQPQLFDGCYRDEKIGTVCNYEEEVPPGFGVVLEGGLSAKIADSAYQTERIDVFAYPLVGSSSVNRAGATGTGAKLPAKLVKRETAVRAAAAENVGNYGSATWNVENKYDVEALGASNKGKVDDVVRVKVGAKNHGPALLHGHGPGEYTAITVKFTVPPGTTVVAGGVPFRCYGLVTENGQKVEKYNQPGLSEYYCHGANLAPGGITENEFQLKITQVITDAKGTVTPLRPSLENRQQGALEDDSNSANNTASVVINPPTGAGGGDDDDVLPITGPNTGVAIGTGLALVLAGAALYLIGRRRPE